MTTLKGIKGDQIRYLDEDPVVQGAAGGSWSSGGSLNEARDNVGSIGISNSAGLIAGGGPGQRSTTEVYNGTSWTTVSALNTASTYRQGQFGTSTSGLLAGAGPTTATESWNGSAWTEVADLNVNRTAAAGSGSSNTSGIVFGGTSDSALTESWNGSTWTEVSDLNTGRSLYGSGGGTTTSAALAAGGYAPPGAQTITESYNGTSWAETGDLNTARYQSAASTAGSPTSFLAFGGNPNIASTESFNGTSWTEVNDLSTGRTSLGGAGSAASAFAAGGSPVLSITEEWATQPSASLGLQEGMLWFNSTSQTLKGYAASIPAGTWSAGGSLNAGKGYGTGFGTQNAALSTLGGYPTRVNNTELYNGTSWTEVAEANTLRGNLGSFGIQTSGIIMGGGNTPPLTQTTTESWNGTSWTSVSGLPTGVYNNRGVGTSSSAGLSVGGVDAATPGKSKKANEWNGSSWTAISDMATIRESGGTSNAGSVTAALAFGGESPVLTVNNEEWNGSAWTELANLNTARGDSGYNGTSTGALCFGGNTPSAPPYQAAITEYWNGTAWTEVADLATGVANGVSPAGGSVAGLSTGGLSNPTTQNTATEEWNAGYTVQTVTTS